MFIKRISPEYAVTGQITPEDVPYIKQAGFNAIMCNRPDGESEDQPPAHLIEAAAKQHGLSFYHVPIGDDGVGMPTLRGFSKVLKSGKYPLLAYCQTGGRCSRLWDAFQG